MLKWISRWIEHPYRQRIDMLPDGFEFFESERGTTCIRWGDVVKVVARKVDDLTIDTIHATVQTSDMEVDITEDVEGFADFEQMMSKSLSPFKTDWKTSVVYPAFEKGETVLLPK